MSQATPSASLGAELPWLIIKGVDVELRAERKADTVG